MKKNMEQISKKTIKAIELHKSGNLFEAKKNYLKAKTDYNNMLTEISLLQSELKRELQLMGKER